MTDVTDHPSLAAALCAFQAAMPIVPKAQTAKITGKDGGRSYSYTYADLADVTAAAMPLLTRHGLSFTAIPTRTEAGSYELVGRLLHTSGGSHDGALPLQGRSAQELGSSITYARRYLLGCMTGIVTDEDDDGQRAQAARERTREEPPAQRSAPEADPDAQGGYPRHVLRVQAMLNVVSDEVKDALSVWWQNAAAEGHLPELQEWWRVTAPQADVVLENARRIRDSWESPDPS